MSRRRSFLAGLVLLAWCSPMFAQVAVETPAAPKDAPLLEVFVTVVELSQTRLLRNVQMSKEWEAFRPATNPLFLMQSKEPFKIEDCLRKLQNAGIARILAEPHFVVLSGRQAHDNPADEAKPTAAEKTRVTVIPTATEKGTILVDFEVDVSSVDSSGGRRTRREHASFDLENDEMGGMGGMGSGLQTTEVVTKQKIWLLGQLPGVGRFFTRERHEEETVELLVLIRPKRVEALSGSTSKLPPAGN